MIRTLRTRLVLIIIAGVTLAILFSTFVHWRDRSHSLRFRSVDHAVERIVGIVNQFDTESSERRVELLRVVQGGPLRLDLLAEMPSVIPSQTRGPRWLKRIRQSFSQMSGGNRPFTVTATENLRPTMQHVQERKPRFRQSEKSHGHGHARVGFQLIAELKDGSAIRFLYRLPHPLRVDLGWLVTLASLLLVMSVVVWFVVRRATRPLDSIARHAAQLGKNLDTPPIPEQGPEEIAQVALALNSMQTNLAESFEQRNRFLASVSHDLATPITRLRLRSEMVEDEYLRKRFLADLDEMEIMVRQTLDYLRDDASREPVKAVDLAALLGALVEDCEDSTGRSIRLEAAEAVIEARPVALKRALANLINNAAQHGEQVSIRLEFTGAMARITISDDGPGIPPAQLERVFEPFFRLDSARGGKGSGLGLSIAHNIILSHGGKLTLANRDPHGLVASIELAGVSQV